MFAVSDMLGSYHGRFDELNRMVQLPRRGDTKSLRYSRSNTWEILACARSEIFACLAPWDGRAD